MFRCAPLCLYLHRALSCREALQVIDRESCTRIQGESRLKCYPDSMHVLRTRNTSSTDPSPVICSWARRCSIDEVVDAVIHALTVNIQINPHRTGVIWNPLRQLDTNCAVETATGWNVHVLKRPRPTQTCWDRAIDRSVKRV